MNKTELNILMLEDDLMDAELSKEQLLLLNEYNCIVNIVSNKKSYIKALENSFPDLILCDYNLPNYTGLEALNYLKEKNPLIPFIFVTGAMNEETAADAIKAGAWDYVVKDRLFRLPLAVRSVLKLKEEKRIAALAEEKVNRLLTAIEQTSVQIVVTDKNSKIEYVNKRFTEVTGYTAEEAIGKKISFLSAGMDSLENNRKAHDSLLKGNIFRGEVQTKKKDGTSYWELVSITPIKNSENEITNFVAVKEDITLRKKMEHELIEARNKAERSDKLKDAFLQNLSHEIRTPLNAIVGFSGLLEETENLSNEKLNYYTSIINNSSKQLLSVVSDVLTISSIQTGQITIHSDVVDINNLFDELYDTYYPMVEEKNIYFKCSKQMETDRINIRTDESKLTEILNNLLSNAIKFTNKGSIELGYRIVSNNIEFYVKDTGIGISKDDQISIFERFRQAEESIHTNYGGTGLGLSISKSFAEMLNGTISVDSEPNIGSTFCLSIPYDSIEEEKIKQKPLIGLPPSLKILIAEDEIYNYLLLETILTRNGNTLYHASNGKEAVEIFRENLTIDVILMDIKMPIMDGITAFKEIRKVNTKVPVIAQTAYALDNDRTRLLELGFFDYIVKPVKADELIEKISNAIIKAT